MITLMTRQKVNPGRVDDYIAIQQKLWKLTHDNEPNMVRYEHFRAEEPNVFISLLSFNSYKDFLDHQVVDYHHEVDWDGVFEDISLQWVEPLQGANTLEPTDLSLPDDLDEARKFYVSMMKTERPEWWDR